MSGAVGQKGTQWFIEHIKKKTLQRKEEQPFSQAAQEKYRDGLMIEHTEPQRIQTEINADEDQKRC